MLVINGWTYSQYVSLDDAKVGDGVRLPNGRYAKVIMLGLERALFVHRSGYSKHDLYPVLWRSVGITSCVD